MIRKQVISLSLKGQSSREIAAKLSIRKSIANDFFFKYKDGHGLQDLPRAGRARKTTIRVGRIISRKAADDPHKNVAAISRNLRRENIAEISLFTVSRRLRDVGLYGRVGVKKLFISKKNQRTRLAFDKEHKDWSVKTGKKGNFPMKRSSTFLGVMADTTSDDLKTKDIIRDMLFLQLSMAEDTLCCGEPFLENV